MLLIHRIPAVSHALSKIYQHHQRQSRIAVDEINYRGGYIPVNLIISSGSGSAYLKSLGINCKPARYRLG